MVRARILTDVSELEGLVPEWRRLLRRAVHAEPVRTPLWLLAWWRQFGDADGRVLRVVVVEEGGELVGLVPLALRGATHRRAIPVRRVELLGTGEDEIDEIASDYVGGLVAEGRQDEVARFVADALVDGSLGAWDELRLPAMSGEDPLVPRLAEALRAPLSATAYHVLTPPLLRELADTVSESAPILSVYLQLTPDRRIGAAAAGFAGRVCADRAGDGRGAPRARPRRCVLRVPGNRIVAAGFRAAAAARRETCQQHLRACRLR